MIRGEGGRLSLSFFLLFVLDGTSTSVLHGIVDRKITSRDQPQHKPWGSERVSESQRVREPVRFPLQGLQESVEGSAGHAAFFRRET